jgi:hypothetical protein
MNLRKCVLSMLRMGQRENKHCVDILLTSNAHHINAINVLFFLIGRPFQMFIKLKENQNILKIIESIII